MRFLDQYRLCVLDVPLSNALPLRLRTGRARRWERNGQHNPVRGFSVNTAGTAPSRLCEMDGADPASREEGFLLGLTAAAPRAGWAAPARRELDVPRVVAPLLVSPRQGSR